VNIPKGAHIIDVGGKFLVPGLIDGFATVNNQAYANAFLYMGVTTLVGLENDNRRGDIFYGANPSPTIMKLGDYFGCQYKRIADTTSGQPNTFRISYINDYSPDKTIKVIDSLASTGVKVLLIHYGAKPEQLPLVVAQARKHGMATIGELGRATYRQALEAGVQSFVHTSRYTVDILPEASRELHTYTPFGRGGQAYYEYINKHPNLSADEELLKLANLFSSANVGLMPTASMVVYPYMEFAHNPWQQRVAAIIDEKDVEFEPLDKTTGKHKNPPPSREQAAKSLWQIDKLLASNRAKYLTGSGCDAFGTLPGISLHTELTMLSSFGLTNREVIAAATGNFALLWGWTHLGKIAAGREADIVVLDANPIESLENLKRIHLLFLDGLLIERKKLLPP
jgi:hypothetical protein